MLQSSLNFIYCSAESLQRRGEERKGEKREECQSAASRNSVHRQWQSFDLNIGLAGPANCWLYIKQMRNDIKHHNYNYNYKYYICLTTLHYLK